MGVPTRRKRENKFKKTMTIIIIIMVISNEINVWSTIFVVIIIL